MSDVIFIAALIAFFALCALYIHLCDRMIGSEDLAIGQVTDSTLDIETANVVVASSGTQAGVTP